MAFSRIGALSTVGLLLVFSTCARAPATEGSSEGGTPSRQPDAESARGGTMGGRGMGGGMMGTMMGQKADTATAPQVAAAPSSAPGCPDVSQELVDMGRKIFTGGGATCFACHGSDAHGTTLAPNLADSTWLDGDGSYAGIAYTVRSGVTKPKKYPAPMPPMGGARLTTEQVCAVAAYVYSLSR